MNLNKKLQRKQSKTNAIAQTPSTPFKHAHGRLGSKLQKRGLSMKKKEFAMERLTTNEDNIVEGTPYEQNLFFGAKDDES